MSPSSKLKSAYPELHDAVLKIEPCIQMLKDLKTHATIVQHYELEARFGKIKTRLGGNGELLKHTFFSAGVSREFIDKAIQMCISGKNKYSSNWKIHSHEWEETHDFFIKNNVRITTKFNSETCSIQSSALVKKKIWQTDIFAKSKSLQPLNDIFDIRISLNQECKVNMDTLPRVTNTKFMRIKQRKRFCYIPTGESRAMWAFDFTLSWSGKNKSDAEIAQATSQPTFEIELEYIGTLAYLRKHSNIKIATSLILKMKDFLAYFHQENLQFVPSQ